MPAALATTYECQKETIAKRHAVNMAIQDRVALRQEWDCEPDSAQP
jgi:hypothetical protein